MKINQFIIPNPGEEIAIIHTNMGDIFIKLFPKEAPKAVENFVTHAKNGYYDGIIFHRVIADFMIQGGDPTGSGMGGESIWGKSFEDYFSGNLFHYTGALSMANSGPNTNGSQFFIVYTSPLSKNPASNNWLQSQGYEEDVAKKYLEKGGTPWLDHGHTGAHSNNEGHMIFGQVFKGLDVVEKISKVRVNSLNSKPIEKVVMEKVEITNYTE